MSDAAPPIRRWLREREEKSRRDEEIVGLAWVWDHVEPVTRRWLDFYDLNALPWGVSILRDNR